MINENFIYIAALLNLTGSLTYVTHTIQGKTKPNRVSWFIWALAPLIAFAAMQSEGVGIQSLMTFMVGFGPLLVFISSFINRNAYWKIDRFDIVCGILSLIGLILWLVTQTGLIAILFSIIADALAGVPTLRKIYKEPQSESYTLFAFGAVAAVITLLTIQDWTFAAYGFPLYIFVLCTTFVVTGYIRTKQLRAK